MLFSNIGILTCSSFVATLAHFSWDFRGILLALFLGVIFLANQVEELYSQISLDGEAEASGILVALYVHLSHLVFCSSLFVFLLIMETSSGNSADILVVFSLVY